ncbi:hypothetical protein DFR72_104594 [Lentzea flaviverrucosa]|uniref:Uncharacterized protein n=1 Tax=Lentzea flaviverrucosa TaxID=200379 RepID=A0A1H9LMK7_9PSEU|nr:hypothetical protein DFR72_104594 [Lentzea flaviverrucosa]SER12588.1 hypothetical protein SAMN05216195_10432 [Lentzea flaviverrucosa]
MAWTPRSDCRGSGGRAPRGSTQPQARQRNRGTHPNRRALLVLGNTLIVIGDDQNDPRRRRLDPVEPRLNPSPQNRGQLLRRSLLLSPRSEVNGSSGDSPTGVVPSPLDRPPIGPNLIRGLGRQPGDGRVVVNPNRSLGSPRLGNRRRRHNSGRSRRGGRGRRSHRSSRSRRRRSRSRRLPRRGLLRSSSRRRRCRRPLSNRGRVRTPSAEEADNADHQRDGGNAEQGETGGLGRTGRACGLGGGHQSSVLLARARTLWRPVRTPRSRLTSIGSAARAASDSTSALSSW